MALAKLRIQLSVEGDAGQGAVVSEDRTVTWAAGVVKRETVSLTGSSTFTALTVPTGAKAVLIIPPSGTTSLTAKGITGDTGTTIVPASAPILAPLFLTLGATPSLGILNDGSTVSVECIWL